MRLENKTALITGGTRGIGLAIAERFSHEGAQVVIAGTDEGNGAEVADRLAADGHCISFESVDMGDPASIRRMVGAAAEKLTHIDILVNNAGVTGRGRINNLDEEMWDRTQDINLKGPVFCMQATRQFMYPNRNSSIINIASIAGLDAPFGNASYTASKAGLIAASEVAAKEFGRDNIRVNTLLPGLVETDMSGGISDSYMEHFIKNTPLKRTGTTQEIASACLFLASDEASFVNGAVLRVDGGLRLR